ncbi:outer membrane protein assembly factor BamE [Rickettsiales bacterium]|nr:outer membrane protein assembly factor BamE [Rickettsiales bacterium]
MLKKIIYLTLISNLLVFNTSCVNKKIVNGQLPDAEMLSKLRVNEDSKQIIKQLLGSPSFKGELGDNSFYYFSTVSDQIAFLEPDLIDQKIIQLKFNSKDILQKIYLYKKNDSKEVVMSSNFTKTTGREISLLEQMISNFGLGMGTKGPILGSGRTGD